jgi:hypothetical protein
MGERGEATAFGVGAPQSVAVEVGFQEAIFLVEIGDDVLLVTLDPSGDHGNEDMQDHGVPRVENRDVMVGSSILTTQDISIG